MTLALPIEVRNLRLEIDAAPTLWLGRVGEKGSIVIHFRWGTLTIRVSHTSEIPTTIPVKSFSKLRLTRTQMRPAVRAIAASERRG